MYVSKSFLVLLPDNCSSAVTECQQPQGSNTDLEEQNIANFNVNREYKLVNLPYLASIVSVVMCRKKRNYLFKSADIYEINFLKAFFLPNLSNTI